MWISNFPIRKKGLIEKDLTGRKKRYLWNSNFIQFLTNQMKNRKIHSKDMFTRNIFLFEIYFFISVKYIILVIYFCQKSFEIKIGLSKSISSCYNYDI